MNKKLAILFLLSIILALLIACGAERKVTQLKGHVTFQNFAYTMEADSFNDKSVETSKQLLLKEGSTLNQEEIMVKYMSEVTQQEKKSLKADYQLSKTREIKALTTSVYNLKEDLSEKEFIELVESVQQEDFVQAVNSNYYLSLETSSKIKTASDTSAKEWNYEMISLPLVWKNNTGSADVTVAVLDTGIDASHPDLKEEVVPGKSYIEKDIDNLDYEIGYIDDHGHGTHVAGIIGASNNGGEMRGVSWDSKLMPVKVLDERGSGTMADIISGIRWAADNGADIINLSLGSTLGLGDEIYEAAFDYAVQQGAVVVSSSGNSNDIKVGHPARYENVIAVGALNQEKKRWSEENGGSSYGAELDIMAPGKNIYSTTPNGNYTEKTGTSMAAPHVAGVIALILAESPELEVDEIRKRLIMSTEDAGYKGKDLEYGYGIINSYAAVYGAQREQVKVFLGEKKNDLIQVKKGPTSPNKEGFFEFELSTKESYSLYAWVDITDSGSIETGDYFASYQLAIGDNFNYNLKLEVIDEDFTTLEVIDY